MRDVLAEIPGPLLYVAVSVALVVTGSLAQALILWGLPRAFPLHIDAAEEARVQELERHYEKQLEDLTVVEYVLSVMAMITLPVANYQLLTWLLSRGASAGDRLLFAGGGAVILGSVVGGALLGPYLTRQWIRARYRRSSELTWLYVRSEDRHGAAGRWLLNHSGVIAACLIVLPAALSANRYTLVGKHRVEVRDPERAFGRRVLPNAGIVAITTEHVGKARFFRVRYRNGESLTSRSRIGDTGDLAGFGKQPRRAVELLSSVTGVPLRE